MVILNINLLYNYFNSTSPVCILRLTFIAEVSTKHFTTLLRLAIATLDMVSVLSFKNC